ncbi:MAG: sugar phosphate isomerase/epimerase [Alphaproteobacteria bacterium]|nr:sugar phosphate isomerase/epimerase [Alphaproteobacteria bacterium]
MQQVSGRVINPLAIEAQVLRDLPADEVVHAAAAAGFDMAGIWIDPAIWTIAMTRRVRRAFRETGLVALDAEVVRITGGEIEDAQRRLIDIAAEIGARHVIAVSLTPDRAASAASLAALADHAAPAGIGIVIEFAPFSSIATVATAIDVATAAGPSVGILPDPIHLIRSGGRPADLATLPPERILFAQICDAGPGPEAPTADSLLWEARHDRYLLGEGTLPLAAYVAALPPGLILSDETRSLKIERLYPDPWRRAQAVGDRLRMSLRVWAKNRQE